MDIYPALVAHIAQFAGVDSVFVELPHDFASKHLPAVQLESAGPARRAPFLQGLGVDAVGVDVNLYVSPEQWRAGTSMVVAHKLRAHLYQFRSGRARATEVSRPEKWPDRNQYTRRIGLTAEILVPA
ncbi:hypothetical protein [Corynebacterium sp. p3-SID1194]|uniref:hypothetical protein n=1 Tax=Corynebacterium sp. p3-SID1194 TaxID=2916105 RepID=UPI0021A43208|nr:hypothetical protein [Corynebacterium sp. p3-SID1194]MCT1450645.1 hypothetical protein [Corynebacterium sp. p3-SID1194]